MTGAGRGGSVPSPDEVRQELVGASRKLGIQLPAREKVEQLVVHLVLLYRWNQMVNLTGIRDFREGVRRHTLESIEAIPVLQEICGEGENELVDLGSGNGYPAIPLFQVLDRLHGTMIESSGRKVDFLRSVVRQAGLLDRVRVEQTKIRAPRQLPEETTIVSLRAFPQPSKWINDLLDHRNVRATLVWLSESDAEAIAEQVRGQGREARIIPLRTQPTGRLLIATS